MIHAEHPMRDVDLVGREPIGESHMVHSLRDRQILQLAAPVGYADGADVVAFGKKQFENHPAIPLQPLALRPHLHLLGHLGDAGGQKPRHAGDLDQTKPTGADIRHPIQVTERRDGNPRVLSRFQHGLALDRADRFAINRECFDRHNAISRCST